MATIVLFDTQRDSIGDTTGMTEDEIRDACNEIDAIAERRVRATYPNAEIRWERGPSMHSFVVYADLDEYDEEQEMEFMLPHILGEAFEEWCG